MAGPALPAEGERRERRVRAAPQRPGPGGRRQPMGARGVSRQPIRARRLARPANGLLTLHRRRPIACRSVAAESAGHASPPLWGYFLPNSQSASALLFPAPALAVAANGQRLPAGGKGRLYGARAGTRKWRRRWRRRGPCGCGCARSRSWWERSRPRRPPASPRTTSARRPPTPARGPTRAASRGCAGPPGGTSPAGSCSSAARSPGSTSSCSAASSGPPRRSACAGPTLRPPAPAPRSWSGSGARQEPDPTWGRGRPGPGQGETRPRLEGSPTQPDPSLSLPCPPALRGHSAVPALPVRAAAPQCFPAAVSARGRVAQPQDQVSQPGSREIGRRE